MRAWPKAKAFRVSHSAIAPGLEALVKAPKAGAAKAELARTLLDLYTSDRRKVFGGLRALRAPEYDRTDWVGLRSEEWVRARVGQEALPGA